MNIYECHDYDTEWVNNETPKRMKCVRVNSASSMSIYTMKPTCKTQQDRSGKLNSQLILVQLDCIGRSLHVLVVTQSHSAVPNSANDCCSPVSVGYSRRLDAAVAVIGDPSVILLDEPTRGVDPLSRRQMWTFLSKHGIAGRTIFITSHK